MIRAIIVDDEQPSLDRLEKLLKDSGLAEVVAKFTEPLKALRFLKEHKADAAFLDIEMPDVDGIALSSRIMDLQGSIAIVFVTAYNQYAVEAFRLNALDYLLKPLSADRLKETLGRISEERNVRVHSAGVHAVCFGRFSVSCEGQEVRFRTQKAEELLAFLIDRRGSFVSRSEIIDKLWDDFDGDRALIHFNTTLHYVKKALLLYGIQMPIAYDRGGYRLDTEAVVCDYLEFCTFVDNAKTAGQENILEYEKTAGLYTGEYLVGREYDWAARKRLQLEEQFICLLLEVAQYYKGTGNYQKAVKWLKAGLAHEPLHRELNYRLIEVLLLLEEQIAAENYYDIYRNELRKKLKQEPAEEFRKLVRWK